MMAIALAVLILQAQVLIGRIPDRMQLRSLSAVTIGSDAANPDAAIPVARSSHDPAAKKGDPGLGGMLRMSTDTSCGRGRFNLNRRVLAATA